MRQSWRELLSGSITASRSGLTLRAKHWMARRYRREFQQAARMTAEEFSAYQRLALERVLAHAVEHVPYYRRRRREYVRNGRALPLRELPVLDKSVVRSQVDQFYADGGTVRFRTSTTAGSTGTPLVVHTSYRAHAVQQAGLERQRAWFGVRPCRRTVELSGFFRPAARAGGQIGWRDCLGNRLFLSTYHIGDERIAEYAELLHRFGPESIVGYAHSAYTLGVALRRNGLTAPPGVKLVVTNGDVLDPDWRGCIEEAFGAPVADQYSSHEAQHLVTECPAGGMHVNPEHGIVEVVDAHFQPAAAGAEGELLLTGLANEAMPLVRYRIGDLAVRQQEPGACACGLCWPRLGRICGRDEDAVRTPDGRWIRLLNQYCTRHLGGIVQSQFVQDAPDHIQVLLVQAPGFGPAQERAIAEEIRRRTQHRFRVDFEYVERIAPGPRGKFRAVVNLLGRRQEQAAPAAKTAAAGARSATAPGRRPRPR